MNIVIAISAWLYIAWSNTAGEMPIIEADIAAKNLFFENSNISR